MSPPQVHHLYECLHKDVSYNPAQIDQFTQIHELDLLEFLYHVDEDEDPVPCFAMTNPYEAMVTHDPLQKMCENHTGHATFIEAPRRHSRCTQRNWHPVSPRLR